MSGKPGNIKLNTCSGFVRYNSQAVFDDQGRAIRALSYRSAGASVKQSRSESETLNERLMAFDHGLCFGSLGAPLCPGGSCGGTKFCAFFR